MADRDKHPVTGQVLFRPGLEVFQPHPGYGVWIFAAQDFLDRAVPDHRHLGVIEQALLQDFFSAQAVAAMDQGDLGGKIGQVKRFFHRRIAAADHDNLFAAIEKPVAGRAGRDAKALEFLLGWQAQPLGLGTGGYDQGIGQEHIARIAGQPERAAG